jgi:GH18 family chitinase
MAYDFSGTWSDRATHQANLIATPATAASVDAAIHFYTSQGVSPAKLVLGMPLYARAFAKTDGLGCPFKGVPSGGAEPGNFFYNVSRRESIEKHLSDRTIAGPALAGSPRAFRRSGGGHLFTQS